jgi:hypothetical protein
LPPLLVIRRRRVGRGRLVEAHALAGLAKGRKIAVELGGLAHLGQRFEVVAHFV